VIPGFGRSCPGERLCSCHDTFDKFDFSTSTSRKSGDPGSRGCSRGRHDRFWTRYAELHILTAWLLGCVAFSGSPFSSFSS
jgi:hypothetical protein